MGDYWCSELVIHSNNQETDVTILMTFSIVASSKGKFVIKMMNLRKQTGVEGSLSFQTYHTIATLSYLDTQIDQLFHQPCHIKLSSAFSIYST